MLPRNLPLRTKTPLRRKRWLLPRSRKTQRRYVQRRALVAELLLYPVVCQVPWCTSLATDPHEPLTRARGGSILDLENVILICRAHHDEIHDEAPWAYELGFLISSWTPLPHADLPSGDPT